MSESWVPHGMDRYRAAQLLASRRVGVALRAVWAGSSDADRDRWASVIRVLLPVVDVADEPGGAYGLVASVAFPDSPPAEQHGQPFLDAFATLTASGHFAEAARVAAVIAGRAERHAAAQAGREFAALEERRYAGQPDRLYAIRLKRRVDAHRGRRHS